MPELLLRARSLKKTFDHRLVFFEVGFELHGRNGLGIVGRNGSGKSTLAKIIAGILSPTAGVVEMNVGGNVVTTIALHEHVGFVAPYLQLYDEFTGWENLDLARRIRGKGVPDERLDGLLDLVNVLDRKSSLVRTYSSGMKQRLKYACALLHDPPVLVLDEPTSNLDSDGIRIVQRIMQEQVERGVVVVATNEDADLSYCTQTVDLNRFLPHAREAHG